MEQGDSPEVPTGFGVRAHAWLPAVLAIGSVAQLLTLLAAFSLLTVFVAALLAFAAAVQASWRATVSPRGLTFENRVGVNWSHRWSDLRTDVTVNRPGRVGSLLRGRLRTGRTIAVANGRVTALGGGEIAPETAQKMMQAWADAGTGEATDA